MDQLVNYYHDHIDDFNSAFEIDQAKHLCVLQWNVRGMNDLHKFDNILLSLDHFIVPIDVIVIGETWIKEGISSLYKIDGYSNIFSCRDNSSGGLAMYIRNTIEYKVIENLSMDGIHHIHVELMLNGGIYDIHGLYRPPSYDFNLFHDLLEDSLLRTNAKRPCFMFGDMNVPVNMPNNNIVLKYKSLLQSYGFICSNTLVTRPASSNILDHVLCKMSDAHRICNYTISNDLSDHSLLLSRLKLN